MVESKELQEKKKANVMNLQSLINSDGVRTQFNNIFGNPNKAGQFLASITTAVRLTPKLQLCNPSKVIEQALIAASINLNVNGSLGECAIIPFKDGKTKEVVPQLQVMTKGITQLCLRSGQYRIINVYKLFKDEYDGKDLITGQIKYHEVPDGMRKLDRDEDVAGYGCYIELVTGFTKNEFWTIDELEAHGRRYSSAYRWDLQNGDSSSLWTSNKRAMYEKTILKMTLNKWGIKSVELQFALEADQNTGRIGDIFNYGDNEQPSDVPGYSTEEMDHRNSIISELANYGITEESIKIVHKADSILDVSTEILEKLLNDTKADNQPQEESNNEATSV